MPGTDHIARALRPGWAYVAGRDSATARLLIDTCVELGYSTKDVRAVSDGYVVPEQVADRIFNPDAASPESTETAPTPKRRKARKRTTTTDPTPETTTPDTDPSSAATEEPTP